MCTRMKINIITDFHIFHDIFSLVKGFKTQNKDSICVKSSKGQIDIKEKLSEACKADKMVYIVKKYCNEEKKGTYFCLKDGRCVGNECIGCVRHKCDIDGKRCVN